MNAFLAKLLPNMVPKWPALLTAIRETLAMAFCSGAVSFVLGLFFGIVLTVTRKDGILENSWIYEVCDKAVNLLRAIPFIILLTCVMPLSRAVMGTAIGVKGAIVPLIFGTVPFFSRQVEGALAEVDGGLVEAGESMGLAPLDIIWRIYLKEGLAALARGTTLTAISLISLTTMAGAVGAGGLGDFAIRYGHDRNQVDVTWVTIVVLVAMVTLIQVVGNRIVKKNTH